MDEEQLQQLQLSQAASAGSTWQMGGGTAGLRAPAYTNNGTYLAPPEPQTTNARPPVTGAPSMYVRTTPSTTASNTAPFDSRRVTNAMYDSGPQTAPSPATSTTGNNQNPVIDAGRAAMNAGNEALANPFVGEGINMLADTNGVARNVSRGMPVAGLYYDSTGLYDNVTGTGSAENASIEERAYNMVANGLGLVSSTIGTVELAGQLLAASSNGLAGSVGTGLVAATAEGTALGGAALAAGSTAALLSAGAGGYALGSYVDQETGLSDDVSNSLNIGINGSMGRNERGFRVEEGIATNPVDRSLSDNIANSVNIAINGGMGPNRRGFRADDANVAAD